MFSCSHCIRRLSVPSARQQGVSSNVGKARGAWTHFSVWAAVKSQERLGETAVAAGTSAGPPASSLFQELGLPLELLDSLERAFPHVKAPTASQAALFKAILSEDSGTSVILRDVTGSGKSLALLLALLSDKQLSRPFHKAKARRAAKATRKKASLEQILLVPHTELAKQFEGWIALLRNPPPLENHEGSIEASDGAALAIESQLPSDTAHQTLSSAFPALRHTQVLHRQSSRPIDISTRFLITTPRYLIDLLDSVSTEHLHTIALDEADEMLKLPNRFHTHKDEAKWLRHPPLLLTIMDELLSSSLQNGRQQLSKKRIVAVSASANSVFRDYIVRRSGWLKPPSSENEDSADGARRFDWYDFSSSPISETNEVEGLTDLQKVGRSLMPQAQINHYLVRVDEQGDFADEDHPSEPSPNEGTTLADPNRYLVAIATLFALKGVEKGLLLIPSSQSLQATLEFLQSVAVPAVGISEAFDPSKHATDTVLYVSSVDSVRGLDIPQLEWIFLTPEIKAQHDAKDYMHISGRVGRLLDSQGSRGNGNVVSLVDVRDHRHEHKLRNVWQLLGIEGKAMSPEELVLPDVSIDIEQN